MQTFAAHEGLDDADYLLDAPQRLRISRLGKLSDGAELVEFLCTEEASSIHGAIVNVDGGQNKGV